jgi:hypothetical protein
MRYWTGAAIAVAIALFQSSSVEQVHILGVVPNLVLVLLASWLVVRGLDDVLPMAGVAGVAVGLLSLQNPGLILLGILAAVAVAGAVREVHVIHSEVVLAVVAVALASLVYEGVQLLGVLAAGGGMDPLDASRHAILPAAVVNLAVAPPVYLGMRFFAAPARRRAYAF